MFCLYSVVLHALPSRYVEILVASRLTLLNMDEETTQEQIKISVVTPLIYVGVLLGAFVMFSIFYRRNKIQKLAEIEPIFKENHPASLYAFLKLQYVDPEVPKDQKPHEKVMKAALLRRGVEAIRRSLKLKENEPIFNRLYQERLIGDDVFRQFEFQAKFQEIEIKQIVQECESYKKGWAQLFFPVAQEICFNEALRRRLNAMTERGNSLAEVWGYQVDRIEKAAEVVDDKIEKSEKKNKKQKWEKEEEWDKETRISSENGLERS